MIFLKGQLLEVPCHILPERRMQCAPGSLFQAGQAGAGPQMFVLCRDFPRWAGPAEDIEHGLLELSRNRPEMRANFLVHKASGASGNEGMPDHPLRRH